MSLTLTPPKVAPYVEGAVKVAPSLMLAKALSPSVGAVIPRKLILVRLVHSKKALCPMLVSYMDGVMAICIKYLTEFLKIMVLLD